MQEPARARADDEQRVARREPEPVLAAQRARERLRAGGGDGVEPVEREQLADQRGLHPDELREPAGVQPRRAELRAQRLVAGAAGAAVAARRMVVDRDAVAGATLVTPAPTSTTSPTGSWPSTAGSLRRTYQPWTSEPHVAEASTRQTTSPGPQAGVRAVLDRRVESEGTRDSHATAATVAAVDRLGGAALGHERPDEPAGVTSNAGLRTVVPGTVSSAPGSRADLVGAALLDLDSSPDGSSRSIEEDGPGRHERDAGRVRGQRQPVGADLVRDVAVGGHAVEAR